ncbi:MAG: hypothetical protein ACI4CS_06535, partial [Candidatus Weimeria sp.]
IKETKYSSKWIKDYAEKKGRVFAPVIKGQKALTRNSAVMWAIFLFIVASDIVTVRCLKTYPGRGTWYKIYIFASLMYLITLAQEAVKAYRYPYRKVYKDASKVIKDSFKLLNQLYSGHVTMEMLYKMISPESDTAAIKQAFDKAGLDTGGDFNGFVSGIKVLDFTANDTNVDECVSAIDELEKALRDKGIITA